MTDDFTDSYFDLGEEPQDYRSEPLRETSWLEGLNPEQRHAVETTEGPLLVLSGAGTGKTKVLTTRLAHILLTGKARPWQILAVTFTNKAAREMRNRVISQVGPEAEQVWLGTFHALAVRMLRRHGSLVGLENNFTIIDSDDQLRLLKQIMESETIDIKKWPPQAAMGQIQRWKDRGLTPLKVSENQDVDPASEQTRTLYHLYQKRLLALNLCDFGDLLLHCVTIFLNPDHREILQHYQEQFRYILVDEYQDTNVGQYLWLRLLAQHHGNLCCVGDDDQSIYSWRGAEVENILRFSKDFPKAMTVRLETNYRSTAAILAAASGLIEHNEGRLGKTLKPGLDSQTRDTKVKIHGAYDGEEEARWVVEEIEKEKRKGTPLDQMAILIRASFQTREFEERLIHSGLPYRVVGGLRFYERQEIRDAIAYLRLITQSSDDLAFERILNVPKRGLGESVVHALHVEAKRLAGLGQESSLMAASRSLLTEDKSHQIPLKARQKSQLSLHIDALDHWKESLKIQSHDEVTAVLLEESGYLNYWRESKTPDAPGRLENLEELIAALGEFQTLQDFLEHISLVMDNDDSPNDQKIAIMTLHGAKGLEFDVVFLPGWEEGVFPHSRSLAESGHKALEEERRLAYVGLTRAKKHVAISYAASRRVYNQWQNQIPSRFIDEIPPEAVDNRASRNIFGGLSNQASGWRKTGFGGGYVSRRISASLEKQGNSPNRQASSSQGHHFKIGDRVFHQKFGYGLIESIDLDKLSVNFEKSDRKMVMANFVESC